MRRMRDMGIGGRILLMFVTITGSAFILAGIVLGLLENYHNKRDLVEEIQVLARVIADRSTAAMSFGDRQVATENLSALMVHHTVDSACLYTPDGNLFARFEPRADCQPPVGGEAYRFDGDFLVIREAVSLNGDRLGELTLKANLSGLQAQIHSDMLVLGAVLVAAVGLAVMFAARLQGLVSRPIRRLVETAERVTETRDYGIRAEAGESGEAGRLVRAFNEMLEVIRDRDQSLSESETRFRDLVEGISAVVYTAALRPRFKLIYVGPQIERILGYSTKVWLADPGRFVAGLHAEDRDRILAVIEGARREHRPYTVEYRFLHPNGRTVWIRDQAEVVCDPDGEPLFYQGLMHDVSESREAQRALQFRIEFERVVERVSRRFIEADPQTLDQVIDWSLGQAGTLVGAGRCYLFQIDADGAHFSNSHEWCAPGVVSAKDRLQSLRKEEFPFVFEALAGQRLFMVDDVADLPESQRAFRDMLQAQDIGSLAIVPLSWDGELRGFLGLDAIEEVGRWQHSDIDLLNIIAEVMAGTLQRLEALEALRQLNEELEKRVRARTDALLLANQEMEAFTYSVSHDLRSPLLVLDGFSQALLEDYGDRLDKEATKYLTYLREGSQELGEMIDALLVLSRSTRGELHRESIDLSALAENCIEELRKAEPQREVRVSIAPDLQGFGDPGLVQRVLVNLLGNAWKYTGHTADARIELGRETLLGREMFFVRDNGAGFDIEHAKKLFQPFQRMHRVDEFPGTGIGLATVKRILVRHGGKVWAESAVGEGATFYFSLGDAENDA